MVSNTYCVVLFCLVFLHLVCPVMTVSLDCLVLIAPSVFSNIYLLENMVDTRLLCSDASMSTHLNFIVTSIMNYDTNCSSSWIYLTGVCYIKVRLIV